MKDIGLLLAANQSCSIDDKATELAEDAIITADLPDTDSTGLEPN